MRKKLAGVVIALLSLMGGLAVTQTPASADTLPLNGYASLQGGFWQTSTWYRSCNMQVWHARTNPGQAAVAAIRRTSTSECISYPYGTSYETVWVLQMNWRVCPKTTGSCGPLHVDKYAFVPYSSTSTAWQYAQTPDPGSCCYIDWNLRVYRGTAPGYYATFPPDPSKPYWVHLKTYFVG